MIDLIYLAVLLPLIGFLVNGIFGSRIKNEKVIGLIGSGAIGLAFLVVAGAFLQTLSLPVDQRTNYVELFTWIKAGDRKSVV